MKFELTLEEVRLVYTNINIISASNGWFNVEESPKKIHGAKNLKAFNEYVGGLSPDEKLRLYFCEAESKETLPPSIVILEEDEPENLYDPYGIKLKANWRYYPDEE